MVKVSLTHLCVYYNMYKGRLQCTNLLIYFLHINMLPPFISQTLYLNSVYIKLYIFRFVFIYIIIIEEILCLYNLDILK
jgi:hypothetical protein